MMYDIENEETPASFFVCPDCLFTTCLSVSLCLSIFFLLFRPYIDSLVHEKTKPGGKKLGDDGGFKALFH